MDFEITNIDLAVVAIYLVASRAIPLWLTRGGQGDTDGFFLGGRNFIWPMIGFSLFATNMSGASFVGMAGAGYTNGIAVFSYEWMAAICLVIFIFFGLAAGVNTMMRSAREVQAKQMAAEAVEHEGETRGR